MIIRIIKFKSTKNIILLLTALFFHGASAETVTLWESATVNTDFPNTNKSGKSINNRYFVGARFYVASQTSVESIGGWFAPEWDVAGPKGGIFGAIISLDSQNDFPDSLDLSTPDVLAHTIVDLDWGPSTLVSRDYTASLPITLDSGWYAIQFGSGLFGATGFSAAPSVNTDVGAPDYLTHRDHFVETYSTTDVLPEWANNWQDLIDTGYCVSFIDNICTYISGSEWDGTSEWADSTTPSAYYYFNGPNSPGNGMRFFVNAAVVPIPSALWLFVSGLVMLWGTQHYKKTI